MGIHTVILYRAVQHRAVTVLYSIVTASLQYPVRTVMRLFRGSELQGCSSAYFEAFNKTREEYVTDPV